MDSSLHVFSSGALGSALILAGVIPCFYKEWKDSRPSQAFLLIWAGINFFIFAATP